MAKTVKFVSLCGQTETSVPVIGSFENGEERVLSDDDAVLVLGGETLGADGEIRTISPNPNFIDVTPAPTAAPAPTKAAAKADAPPPDTTADTSKTSEG